MGAPLSDDQLAALARCVEAVVSKNDAELAVMCDSAAGDLYEWTQDYGSFGDVELVRPPGPPATWELNVTETIIGSWFIVVGMWTRQEGRSDLSLELELLPDGHVQIQGLHVL